MVQWALSVSFLYDLGTILGHSYNLLLEASNSAREGILLASNGEARRAELLTPLGTAQSMLGGG